MHTPDPAAPAAPPRWGDDPPDRDVRTRLDRGVLTVTLNRPERMNATTPEMIHRYMQALLTAAADPSVRVIVVTGAGRAFCAGADARYLDGASTSGLQGGKLRRHVFTARIPKPLIAAINGPCVGVGLVMAMMCDMRFAARSARMGAVFTRLGLPAENGVAWVLQHSLGYAKAFEVMALGRLTSGDELMRLGLVNDVLDDDALMPHVTAIARELADRCSPRAVALVKHQLLHAADAVIGDADALSESVMPSIIAGHDFREAMAARRESREPRFADLPPQIADWWPPQAGGPPPGP